MNNSPALKAKFSLRTYEALHKRFRWEKYQIRGRAIEAGEMTHGLIDPDSKEPKHVRAAIKQLQRQLAADARALLKNWNPDNLERPQ